jgi:hypothetical protein
MIQNHGDVLLPNAGKHVHLLSQASHAKVLKMGLGLVGFPEMICAAVENWRRSELRLVRKRRTKCGEGKELLERQ